MSIIIDLGDPAKNAPPVVTLGWGQEGYGYVSWRKQDGGPAELLHADPRIAVGTSVLMAMARPGGFEGWTLLPADDDEEDPARLIWVARFQAGDRLLVYRPAAGQPLLPDDLVVLEMPD